MGVQTSVRDIIAKLKTWRDHPEWSTGRAAKELSDNKPIKKPTLLGWKKKYCNVLHTIQDPGDRMREKGGGRKRKTVNATGTKPAPTPNLATELAPETSLMTNISTRVRDYDDSDGSSSGDDRDSETIGDSAESDDSGKSSGGEECSGDGANGVRESEHDETKGSSSDSDVEMVDAAEAKGHSILKSGVAAAIAAKPVQSEKTRRFFRARYPSYVPLVVYTDPETNNTLHVFTDDSDSLLNNTTTTGNAIDYFIYRYMKKKPGVVCPVGTAVFAQVELAYTARSPSKKKAVIKSSMSMFDWSAYPYVLVPLSGRNHWSFLIVEHTSSWQQGKLYHVDSLKGAHSSEYVFAVFKWLFARYVADKTVHSDATLEATTSEFKTKPQQTNFLDCGIYLLYYMDRISTLIASRQLTSIEDDLATWTHSGFNATKAEQYRALLHQRLHEDMTPQ